jgi:hypothetical protein
MKALTALSAPLMALLIFVLLALAIYVFRTLPYLLAAVLIAEVVVLAAAILAPLLSGGARKGWFGRALFALLGVGLANTYMLFLAHRWSVEPGGLYATVLHWQDGLVRGAGLVIGFVDALLKAVFSLNQGPIASLLDHLRPPSDVDLGSAFPGGGGRMAPMPLATIVNVLVGVIGSLWTALVLKRVLRGGGHGGHAEPGHGRTAH